MSRTPRLVLSPEQEAEAQALALRIRELSEEEYLLLARLLVSKSEGDLFGDTEFQVRDILLRAGAKAFAEHLRQKKMATGDPVSTVRSASKRPTFRGIDPSPR
jgi:hypothetical protein